MSATLRVWLVRFTMRPVDLLLRLISENYSLFVWFFSTAPASMVAALGSLRAVRAADFAARRVPAYSEFLASNGVTPADVARFAVPSVDKENYIKRFGFAQRCVDGAIPARDVVIDESSGSTGTPYNWVRSVRERRASHLAVSHFARHAFGDEPWITVNAFSMGAWATGINMGIALQRNSIVKNTGPDLAKIFGTLEYFGPEYRYLVCGYPPFLKQLIDAAEERGFSLRAYRLNALLGGEGNSEGLRDYLLRSFEHVFSGYGATDVEIGIAGETPTSVAVRRAARNDAALHEVLFGRDSRLPMLFQYNPLMHHIVVNDAEELNLTITRTNVLCPRIMYNIHDEGGVAPFREMQARWESAGFSLDGQLHPSAAPPVPLPFLWVYGRKDSTVSIMGANIYPEDLEQCLYDEPELARITHSFCLGLHEDADAAVRPRFSFEVTSQITPELEVQFRERIVARLIAMNADFREAMKESQASATPVVELYPLGAGPFAVDAKRIKQVRVLGTTAS